MFRKSHIILKHRSGEENMYKFYNGSLIMEDFNHMYVSAVSALKGPLPLKILLTDLRDLRDCRPSAMFNARGYFLIPQSN